MTEAKMAACPMVEQLKATRSSARRRFMRQANSAVRMLSLMSEQELKDTFRSLSLEADKVLEANEDLEEQYGLQLEAGALSPEQRSDLDQFSSECESKLSELKDLIVQTLWSKFGEEELSLAVEAAEAEAERARAVQPSEDREVFDFRLELLGQLLGRAKELHTHWKSWAPPEQQQRLQGRVRELERALNSLTARKAEFIKVKGKTKPRSSSAGQRSAPPTTAGRKEAPPTAAGRKEAPPSSKADSSVSKAPSSSSPGHRGAPVSLPDPRSLPAFPGPGADLQRWRREWAELQERADPGASAEVRREKLLSCIDQKTAQELRLSQFSTAEEVFAELERRYGNQTNHVKKKSAEGDHANTAVEMAEQLLKEGEEGPGSALDSAPPLCIICGHSKHGLRLYFCRKFQALKLKEKKEAVRRLGACRRCLEVHEESESCKTEFLCQREECGAEQHHYSLCPRKERPRTFTPLKTKVTAAKPRAYLALGGGAKPLVYPGVRPHFYSRAQQEFVKKLPPELAKEFKQAFRSSAPRAANSHPVPRPALDSQSERSFRGFRGWTPSHF